MVKIVNSERLSANKQAFSPPYTEVFLLCGEIHTIANYYRKKKGIQIFVQKPNAYLHPSHQELSAQHDMAEIQHRLKPDQYAGYLYTRGGSFYETRHVECIIIAKNRLIKPLVWNLIYGSLEIANYPQAASTDIYQLLKQHLSPQSSKSNTCGALSLSYLKQLLKNNAQQLKELTFIFPYNPLPSSHEAHFDYFFIPSPQVLRYSHSYAYNAYLAALVLQDNPGFFTHQNKTYAFTPIRCLLEVAQTNAKRHHKDRIHEEIVRLKTQLPAFREKWKTAYEAMHIQRERMERGLYNRGLAYASNRFQKIVRILEEAKTNPSLPVLKKLHSKRHQIEAKRLSYLFLSMRQLTFNSHIQLAYFLRELGRLIDSQKSFPLVFQDDKHILHLKNALHYKDCLFLLNQKQRDDLNGFFYQKEQFSRFYAFTTHSDRKPPTKANKNPDVDPIAILNWLYTFIVPEEQKLSFLRERISPHILRKPLLDYLLNKGSHDFNEYFETTEGLTTFFREYIPVDSLLEDLPRFIGKDLKQLKILFHSDDAFYDFIETYLPLPVVLPVFQQHHRFIFYLERYFACLNPIKSSSFVLHTLQDPLSEICIYILKNVVTPIHQLLTLISTFCNETDIETYLKINRVFLLQKMLERPSINPLMCNDTLRAITVRMHFFFCEDQVITELYRKAFINPDDRLAPLCLKNILILLPENIRWDFVDFIFRQHEPSLAARFISNPTIHRLLPPKDVQKKSLAHKQWMDKDKFFNQHPLGPLLSNAVLRPPLFLIKEIENEASSEEEKLSSPPLPTKNYPSSENTENISYFANQKIANALIQYINRIESHLKKNGDLNYAAGFYFFSKSRALNRQRNHLLAKTLLSKLQAGENLTSVLDTISNKKNALIINNSLNTQSSYMMKNLHSTELKAIILEAESLSNQSKQAGTRGMATIAKG